MYEKKKIEVGDMVKVAFYGAQMTLCHKAKVLRIPQVTGDSWVFESYGEHGEVYYVSEGCTITLLKKAGA